MEDFTCSPDWRRISHKLHKLLVENASNLGRLLLRPFLALVIDVLHETLNELVLSVVLKIEILIFRRLASILRCVDEFATLIKVQIHYLEVNVGISHQLDLANAKHL
jgi:hypothetical protein